MKVRNIEKSENKSGFELSLRISDFTRGSQITNVVWVPDEALPDGNLPNMAAALARQVITELEESGGRSYDT